ncbi:hypothetical protein N9248_02275 [bacterium]|nr:hypothetical protein [bacterium]
MKFVLEPCQLMLIILADWIKQQQQQRIDYLETIVTVLQEHNGKRRILLTDELLSSSGFHSLHATPVSILRSKFNGPKPVLSLVVATATFVLAVASPSASKA